MAKNRNNIDNDIYCKSKQRLNKKLIDHYTNKIVFFHSLNALNIINFIYLSSNISFENNSGQLIQSAGKVYRKNIEEYYENTQPSNWRPTI